MRQRRWMATFLPLVQVVTYSVAIRLLEDEIGYTGLKWALETPLVLAACTVICLGVGLSLPVVLRRPSDAALWIFASFLVTPQIALLACNANYRIETGWPGLIVALTGFLGVRTVIAWANTPPAIRDLPEASRRAQNVALALALLAIVLTLATYGFRGLNLGLDDIYERRLAIRSVTSLLPGSDHVILWGLYLGVAGLLVGVIATRRWWLLAPALALPVLMFSVNGARSILFLPVLAAGIVVSVPKRRRPSVYPLFGLFLTAVLLLPVLLKLTWPESIWVQQLTRRLGLVPAQVTQLYVEFADSRGFVGYGHLLPQWLTGSADRLNLPRALGEFIGAPENHVSANPWAEGYVAASWAGVFVASLVIGLALSLADRLGAAHDRSMAVTLVGIPSFSWVNASLVDGFVSYGVALALILLWVTGQHHRAKAAVGSTVSSTPLTGGKRRSHGLSAL